MNVPTKAILCDYSHSVQTVGFGRLRNSPVHNRNSLLNSLRECAGTGAPIGMTARASKLLTRGWDDEHYWISSNFLFRLSPLAGLESPLP